MVNVKHSARTTEVEGRDADQAEAATTAAVTTRTERFIGDAPGGVGMSLTPEERTVSTPMASRLAVVWPQMERYLRRALRARGVPRTEADDVLQEVALRALERSPCENGTDDELLGWAYVVAVNKDIDRRRSASVEDRRSVPEAEGTVPLDCREVETAVEARLAVDAVWRELAKFTPADRDAVLAGLTPYQPSPGTDPRAEAVRRHRGRARLRTAVRRAVGAIVPPVWLRQRVRAAPTPSMSVAACVLGQVALGVVTSVVTGVAPTPRHSQEASLGSAARTVTAAQVTSSPMRNTALVERIHTRAAPRSNRRGRRPAPLPEATRLATVAGPAGTRADLDRSPDPGDGRLVCVKNLPNHGDEICLYQPPGVELPAQRRPPPAHDAVLDIGAPASEAPGR